MRLTDFFEQFKRQGQVASIIGCGGKTSLMWSLAAQTRKQKTLVTTTTHTQKPDQAAGLFDYFFNEAAAFSLKPPNGTALAGNLASSGASISSFSLSTLERIIPLFDYVFIEADGSRALPLKAWAAYEPVITESTSITIGILPLWPLGQPLSEALIHRLSLFTALSGAKEGDSISLEHYVPVISGHTVDGIDMDSALKYALNPAHSLFYAVKSKKILFFNQIEDKSQFEKAVCLTRMLPPDFRAELSAVIAGSIHENRIELLY
jgi:probable selenium-dependent hydroxylase accessory protein YqeC